MDEYKDYLYKRQPWLYEHLNPGDLTKQRALRKRLQCKPFKWFMERVAFDLIDHFPLDEPSFAYGGIKNLGMNLCVDTLSKKGITPIGLYPCAENISYPQFPQTFSLALDHSLRVRFDPRCLTKMNANLVWLVSCWKHHKLSRQQLWRYDMVELKQLTFA